MTSSSGELDSTTSSEHDLFIRALLMLVLITAAMNLAHFLKHKNFTYLGESAVFILFGLIISIGWTSIAYDPGNTAIQLNSEFFTLVLLPPIIFEGGFTLQRTSFFTNIIPILSLALIGAFYSTFVTSLIMWGFSYVISDTNWTFIESLVFGALISSTDPVTVLSLLPSNVDKRLYMLIFGESALNDAVAIILYRFFTGLQGESGDLGPLPFLVSVLASFGVFLGSFCVGVVMAMIFAKITKHVWIEGYEGAIYEMVMLFVFAYSSYLLAEILSLTGIISIFFCGIAMAHYAYSNLTELTRRTMKVTIRMISLMCEGFIFLYLGLGLLSFGTSYNFLFVICAMLAILVSRTHVFIICSLSQFFPGEKKIPLNQQTLMWFSGLRGAVAFALGVTFLEHPDFDEDVKQTIFGTTVIVVVLTVLIFGGLTPYMLRVLKITSEGGDGQGEHEAIPTNDEAGSGGKKDDENAITEADLEQPVFGWLYQLDAKYIRPHFSHNAKDHIQALEVIHRRESRNSRQSSIIDSRVGNTSTLSLRSSVKSPTKRAQTEDHNEHAKLVKATTQAEDIALEAVSLN